MKQLISFLGFILVLAVLSSCRNRHSENSPETSEKSTYKPIEALKESTRLEKMGMTEKQVRFNDDSPDAQQLIVPASQMINQKSYKTAIEFLDKYIALRPDRAIGYMMRGFAQTETNDYSNALTNMDKVLSITPENNYARMLKGICHLKLNQLPEAWAAFGNVIKKEPKNMLAFYNRGQVLAFMQRYKEALADFDEAIRLQPDYAPAYNNRGNVKFLAGDKDGACSDWQRSMEMGNTASEKSYLTHCQRERKKK